MARQYQSIGAVVQEVATGHQYQTTVAVAQEAQAAAATTKPWLHYAQQRSA